MSQLIRAEGITGEPAVSTSSPSGQPVLQEKDSPEVIRLHNERQMTATATTISPKVMPGNSNTCTKLTHSASPITLYEGRIEFNVQEPITSFTGRKDVIKELYEALGHRKPTPSASLTPRIKIISGMAGIGKTQTVRAYIKKCKDCYDHILWINAENRSEAINCFLRLTELIGLDTSCEGKEKAEEDILEQVYDFVCKKFALIIYDNLESFAVKDSNDGLHLLLPRSLKPGWEVPGIIVTTRNRHWSIWAVTEMSGLTEDESYHLFSQLKFEDSDDTRQLVKQIVTKFQGSPLVLQQVISLIREKQELREALDEQPYTLRDFLTELAQSRKPFLRPNSDDAITKDVVTVFQMVFDQLETKPHGSLAIKCLNLMALLNPDTIPTVLLTHLLNEDRTLVAGGLNLLYRYNLVSRFTGFYQIHRTIQAIKLESPSAQHSIDLSSTPDPECTAKTNIKIADIFNNFSALLTSMKINTSFVHEILENGVRLCSHADMQSDSEICSRFKEDLAEKLKQRGRRVVAAKLTGEVFEDRTRLLGNPDSLMNPKKIALVLYNEGKYEKAAKLFRAILEIENSVLGREHTHTLTTQHNLASVLQDQEKYEEAEKLFRNVLDIKSNLFGPEHPDSLITQHNLASVLQDQEKYEEAEKHLRVVLEIRNNVLGPKHTNTLTTQHNLASVLQDQEKYEEAEKLFRDVLEIKSNLFGPEHPDSLITQHNLASVLQDQEKYEEAEKLFRAVLEIRNNVLGPEHTKTLTTRLNLASLLQREGKYEEAENIYRAVLEIESNLLAPSTRTA